MSPGVDLAGHLGEPGLLGIFRQAGVPGVLVDPPQRLLHEIVELFDQGLDIRILLARAGDRDLLDGVLQLGARGLEVLHQIGPVQQLHRQGLHAFQPARQHALDRVPGVRLGQVVRCQAGQARLGVLFLELPEGFGAALEDGNRPEGAGLVIEGFLGHAGGPVRVPAEQVVGEFDGGIAAVLCLDEGPAGFPVLLEEDFVVDIAGHPPPP